MKLIYYATIMLLVRYRNTIFGPLWIIMSPLLFISTVGVLYTSLSGELHSVFVPHLVVGYITWSLIAVLLNEAPNVYINNKVRIMQAASSVNEIVIYEQIRKYLIFFHQLPIIYIVLIYYKIYDFIFEYKYLIGLLFIALNGVWVTQVFGILGARYRDLSEIFQAVMRIAFLATPIIWMPGEGGRGGVMGAYLTFNPFYHFLEVVRAPLLGQPVALLSWGVVLAFTVFGFTLAFFMNRRYARFVPLWV